MNAYSSVNPIMREGWYRSVRFTQRLDTGKGWKGCIGLANSTASYEAQWHLKKKYESVTVANKSADESSDVC